MGKSGTENGIEERLREWERETKREKREKKNKKKWEKENERKKLHYYTSIINRPVAMCEGGGKKYWDWKIIKHEARLRQNNKRKRRKPRK